MKNILERVNMPLEDFLHMGPELQDDIINNYFIMEANPVPHNSPIHEFIPVTHTRVQLVELARRISVEFQQRYIIDEEQRMSS